MNRAEQKAKAIRLLRLRAGCRYNSFEAGQLYEICLNLGMVDSRPGRIGEQERTWQTIVCSFSTEKEAEQKLKQLLSVGGKT